MTILFAILCGYANHLRGLQKPFQSEQLNRLLYALTFGLAAWNPLTAIGAFLGILIPHGQWWQLKYRIDYLWMFLVMAARGALILVPVGHYWAIPITALIGLIILRWDYTKWHFGWAMAVGFSL